MTEYGLTEQQLRVAKLVPFYSDSEIADMLAISMRTVKQHADVARLKLGRLKTKKEIGKTLRELGVFGDL